jgi:hypothetical protein
VIEMQHLTEALAMDVAGIARAVGVTARTVQAWVKGTRGPAERNRIKLARLVRAAQVEHSSADHRFSISRDRALTAARLSLMSADERKLWEASRVKMQQQFAAPVQREATAEERRAARHAVWASYRTPAPAPAQEPLFA